MIQVIKDAFASFDVSAFMAKRRMNGLSQSEKMQNV